MDETLLRGIPAKYWRKFFKAFVESKGAAEADRVVETLSKTIASSADYSDNEVVQMAHRLTEAMRDLLRLASEESS